MFGSKLFRKNSHLKKGVVILNMGVFNMRRSEGEFTKNVYNREVERQKNLARKKLQNKYTNITFIVAGMNNNINKLRNKAQRNHEGYAVLSNKNGTMVRLIPKIVNLRKI